MYNNLQIDIFKVNKNLYIYILDRYIIKKKILKCDNDIDIVNNTIIDFLLIFSFLVVNMLKLMYCYKFSLITSKKDWQYSEY